MTVALRSICRDYPAGGGILRELLQNADDAGASSVVRRLPLPFLLQLCPSFFSFGQVLNPSIETRPRFEQLPNGQSSSRRSWSVSRSCTFGI